jgi:DNA-binding transcriptional ArsR family regulator
VEAATLDTALRALADENRRTILSLVRDKPLAVGDIADRVDVTQQAVSHHLRVLKKAGLVDERRDGTRHLFVVRTDGFEAVRSYLDDFWPNKLVALKKAVEDAAHG